MAQSGTEFRWSKHAERAALLVAKDEEPDEAIATACKVGRRTLARWKQHPAFQARIEEHRAAWRDEVKRKGIAEKQNRIDGMVARHQLLERLREARAVAYKDGPGGETGLLAGKIALVKVYNSDGDPDEETDAGDGSGDTLFSAKRYREVWEYSLDTGLLKEFRELEKQIAQELGEWVDKQAMTDSKGKDLDLASLLQLARDHQEPAHGD